MQRAERRPREAKEEEEELSSIIPASEMRKKKKFQLRTRRAAAYANVGGGGIVFGWKIYCFRAAEYFYLFFLITGHPGGQRVGGPRSHQWD